MKAIIHNTIYSQVFADMDVNKQRQNKTQPSSPEATAGASMSLHGHTQNEDWGNGRQRLALLQGLTWVQVPAVGSEEDGLCMG
jgi:hypothetical protein